MLRPITATERLIEKRVRPKILLRRAETICRDAEQSVSVKSVLAALSIPPIRRAASELHDIGSFLLGNPLFLNLIGLTPGQVAELDEICRFVLLDRSEPGELLARGSSSETLVMIIIEGRCSIYTIADGIHSGLEIDINGVAARALRSAFPGKNFTPCGLLGPGDAIDVNYVCLCDTYVSVALIDSRTIARVIGNSRMAAIDERLPIISRAEPLREFSPVIHRQIAEAVRDEFLAGGDVIASTPALFFVVGGRIAKRKLVKGQWLWVAEFGPEAMLVYPQENAELVAIVASRVLRWDWSEFEALFLARKRNEILRQLEDPPDDLIIERHERRVAGEHWRSFKTRCANEERERLRAQKDRGLGTWVCRQAGRPGSVMTGHSKKLTAGRASRRIWNPEVELDRPLSACRGKY